METRPDFDLSKAKRTEALVSFSNNRHNRGYAASAAAASKQDERKFGTKTSSRSTSLAEVATGDATNRIPKTIPVVQKTSRRAGELGLGGLGLSIGTPSFRGFLLPSTPPSGPHSHQDRTELPPLHSPSAPLQTTGRYILSSPEQIELTN